MKNTVCMMTSEESFMNNYGAALQGYALFYTVNKLGYSPKIVRYDGGMSPRNKDLSAYRRLYRLGSRTYHWFLSLIRDRETKRLKHIYGDAIKEREEYFRSFQASNMAFYSDSRVGWFDLRDNPPDADVYLCGSDQIWNPYFRGNHNDLGYFLDFVPEGKPRIAYAPSLGCETLPEPAKANFADLIRKFRAVSVREQEGSRIIAKEVGSEVPVVADPTLLLTGEEWQEIESPVSGLPDRYILCYRFSDNAETREQINSISEQTGLPVLSLPLSIPALRDNDTKIFNAGPAEFVWLIHHAALVCTDSFHATVFSLIFETPFYVFLRENFDGEKENMNSRVVNLLDMAELQERLLAKNRVLETNKVYSADFSTFRKNAKALRERSQMWLKKALEGIID